MRKRTIEAWKKQIERNTKAVGVLRDKIRSDLSDMEELADACDRAYQDMQNAIDALSELA